MTSPLGAGGGSPAHPRGPAALRRVAGPGTTASQHLGEGRGLECTRIGSYAINGALHDR
jgi:hypothetical protein